MLNPSLILNQNNNQNNKLEIFWIDKKIKNEENQRYIMELKYNNNSQIDNDIINKPFDVYISPENLSKSKYDIQEYTEMDKAIEMLDGSDRHPNDGEIEDGWFWWTIRFAANDAGYYKDAKTANKFYDKITSEIEKAQEEGKLGKQKTMPSALMSPWRKGYTKKLSKTFVDIYKYTNSFKDLDLKTTLSSGSNKNIGLFEVLTNNKAIYPYDIDLIGSYSSNDDTTINLLYGDNVLKTIECNKNCTFDYSSNEALDDSNIYVSINKNGSEEKIKIYDFIRDDRLREEHKDLSLTYDTNYEVVNNQTKVAKIYNAKINLIGKIYKCFGLIVGLVSLVLYFVVTFFALFKDHKLIDKWLIISSIIATYIVLCLGVSYNHISSCYSISTLYLSGAYPLIITLNLLTIFVFIDIIIKGKKKKLSN